MEKLNNYTPSVEKNEKKDTFQKKDTLSFEDTKNKIEDTKNKIEDTKNKIEDIKEKELKTEMQEAGGYDNLPDNKKLDYRIHVMKENPEQAKLELKLRELGGFDNLSKDEQEKLNNFRYF